MNSDRSEPVNPHSQTSNDPLAAMPPMPAPDPAFESQQNREHAGKVGPTSTRQARIGQAVIVVGVWIAIGVIAGFTGTYSASSPERRGTMFQDYAAVPFLQIVLFPLGVAVTAVGRSIFKKGLRRLPVGTSKSSTALRNAMLSALLAPPILTILAIAVDGGEKNIGVLAKLAWGIAPLLVPLLMCELAIRRAARA